MIKKLLLKLKGKDEKTKNGKDIFLTIFPFIIFIFLCIYVYLLSKDIILLSVFALSIILILLSSYKKDERDDLKERIDFYYEIVRRASLFGNYKKGYRMAINNLPISEMKDELIKDTEKETFSLIPRSKMKEEHLLINDFYYHFVNDEKDSLPDYKTTYILLKNFISSIDKRNSQTCIMYFIFPLSILLTVLLYFFTFCG